MVTYKKEYLALVKVLSALLYAYDPDGMGMSVGSPYDEYDDPARRLIAELTKAGSREAIIATFRSRYPDAPEILSDAVVSAVNLYAHSTNESDGPGRRPANEP